VLDAAVIPVYDPTQATEIPRAYIVPHDAATADDALKKDIENYVASKVAPHKKLRGGVVFIQEIPKSASGKILRKDIVKLDSQSSQTKARL
jgi:acyl-coenzyme A synthetase/AMP-(fatty) acid ligase